MDTLAFGLPEFLSPMWWVMLLVAAGLIGFMIWWKKKQV